MPNRRLQALARARPSQDEGRAPVRWLALLTSLGVLLATVFGLAGLARFGYGPLRVLAVTWAPILGILAVAGGILLAAWFLTRRL